MKLNGRWFPKIVDRDSGNLYLIYPPFPCSDLDPKCVGVGEGCQFKNNSFSFYVFFTF